MRVNYRIIQQSYKDWDKFKIACTTTHNYKTGTEPENLAHFKPLYCQPATDAHHMSSEKNATVKGVMIVLYLYCSLRNIYSDEGVHPEEHPLQSGCVCGLWSGKC